MIQLRRPTKYPYLFDERPIGLPRACECCDSPATKTIKIATSATADLSVMDVCDRHFRMARYREFPKLMHDLDKKIEVQAARPPQIDWRPL